MPATPHIEKHFTAGDSVRDVVIGMSDGLTVPFALAAGLTGAISASRLIVTAGFAEIAAGSIAMGLGGYLAARLKRAGVGYVEDLGLCTYADASRFFSYRRTTHRAEADYGRHISAIALTGE